MKKLRIIFMENRILLIENIGKQYGIILFKKHCSINHVQIKRLFALRFWCLFIRTSEKEKKIIIAHVRGKLSDWHCLLNNMSNTVMLMSKNANLKKRNLYFNFFVEYIIWLFPWKSIILSWVTMFIISHWYDIFRFVPNQNISPLE